MPEQTTVIRKATAFEYEELTAIAMASKAHWGYSQSFIQTCAHELVVTQDDLHNPLYVYWVILFDNEIAGYAALKPNNEEMIELDALFIKPSHMRKGAGSALFKHFLPLLKVSSYSCLTILSDPQAAMFYESMGASLVGEKASGSIANRFLPVYELSLK